MTEYVAEIRPYAFKGCFGENGQFTHARTLKTNNGFLVLMGINGQHWPYIEQGFATEDEARKHIISQVTAIPVPPKVLDLTEPLYIEGFTVAESGADHVILDGGEGRNVAAFDGSMIAPGTPYRFTVSEWTEGLSAIRQAAAQDMRASHEAWRADGLAPSDPLQVEARARPEALSFWGMVQHGPGRLAVRLDR